jgi:hypothetical protein
MGLAKRRISVSPASVPCAYSFRLNSGTGGPGTDVTPNRGENSLNYRAKEDLALLSTFYEHHASVPEKYKILEISFVSSEVW